MDFPIEVAFISDDTLRPVADLFHAEWPDSGWSSETVDVMLRPVPGAYPVVVKVATAGGRVGAAIAFEVAPRGFNVLRIAVSPQWRRRGVGRYLVEASVGHLAVSAASARRRIRTVVNEYDVRAQLFFRALGFAVGTGKKGINKISPDNDGRDWYVFDRLVRVAKPRGHVAASV